MPRSLLPGELPDMRAAGAPRSDADQVPAFLEYVDATGRQHREVYYHRKVTRDGVEKVLFETADVKSHEEAIAEMMEMPESELNPQYFADIFAALFKEITYYRGIMAVIQTDKDFDASNVEDVIYKFCKKVHILEMYARKRRMIDICRGVDLLLRDNDPVRAMVDNCEWLPPILWRRGARDYLEQRDLQDINAMFMGFVSLTGSMAGL